MPSYGKLRQKLEAALKQRMGEMGFVRQSKEFRDFYVRFGDESNHSIQCKIDTRCDISLHLRFGLRFEAVSRLRRLVNDEVGKTCTVEIDPEEAAYCWSLLPDFECFYERLVGLDDFTADSIEAENELESLCERTVQRVREYGIPFFNNYGSLASVARVVEADSPDWRFLAVNRNEFLVSAAATMFVVHGRKAMLDYLKKRDADSRWDCMCAEMLIGLTEPKGETA